MTEPWQILNYLEHNLDILEKDLKGRPFCSTEHQRVQICQTLVKSLKDKESE